VHSSFLRQAWLCGGIDFIATDVRPFVLSYPQDFEVGGPGYPTARADPDADMCRMLLLSVLLDAAEHDSATVVLDQFMVEVRKEALVILRALWDGVPELRPLYQEFFERFEDVVAVLPR
jgi:hypothetical protein